MLSKDEEFELAIRYWKNKDLEAAHKLVTSNLRFVIKIANEYANYGLKLMDVVQEGNIGLMRAVKTYNPYKDTRLITYAVWWIRSYIHDYIQRNWSLVKIGTTQAQRKLFYKLQKEKQKLDQYDLEYSPKLLAQKLGVREKDVIEMDQRMHSRDLSLDAPLKEGEDKSARIDFIVDDKGNAAQFLEEKEESLLMTNKLKEFEKTLKERDLFIYRKRLVAEKPMTLQSIADKYKISKERARQLEEKIKNNLKTFLS
ncbi:MAG: RNA polymerase factor sigma-32 [Deltaproteobacteria bacterium]|nr:RNA polymerase factor sigma-32 [Deltaproteobacteria bacterium]